MAISKGLSAILADAAEVHLGHAAEKDIIAAPAAVSEILLENIVPNPYQPRTTFDEGALAELAESINALGIIQPLTLRLLPDGKYQIISGERRYRASKAAGLKSVPAYVRKADDTAMLEMAIVENLQRENLDAIETAIGFQRLIDECKLTQEAMASRVGKKRTTVTNYLRLLNLPPEIQKAIKAGLISAGHAKALLSVTDSDKQLKFCEHCISNEWSVRQLEDHIRKDEVQPADPVPAEIHVTESVRKAASVLGGYFNGNVSFTQKPNGGGKFTVKFKDEEQLEHFLKALEGQK